MRLDETYERSGRFWIDGDEDNVVSGTLKVENGGRIALHILGSFPTEDRKNPLSTEIPKILGEVSADGYVTLENCFYIKRGIRILTLAESVIGAEFLYIGAGISGDDKCLFDSFTFSIDGMDDWLEITGINTELDIESKSAAINYKLPEPIELGYIDGMESSIVFSFEIDEGRYITESKISQHAFFNLRSADPITTNEFSMTAHKICTLLCLATDKTLNIKNLTATNDIYFRNKEKCRKIKFKIYYESLPFSEKKPVTYSKGMLFPYKSIKDNYKDIFQRWVKAYEDIGPSLSLYFKTKGSSGFYIQSQFLYYAQSLEALHRRTASGTMHPEEDFKKVIEDMIEVCPDQYKDYVRERFKFANEPSLRRRLKELITPFRTYFGSSENREKLVTNIVDARNYYTHYGKDASGVASDTGKLYLITLKMEALLQLQFLRHIGFTEGEISDFVKYSRVTSRKFELMM